MRVIFAAQKLKSLGRRRAEWLLSQTRSTLGRFDQGSFRTFPLDSRLPQK